MEFYVAYDLIIDKNKMTKLGKAKGEYYSLCPSFSSVPIRENSPISLIRGISYTVASNFGEFAKP